MALDFLTLRAISNSVAGSIGSRRKCCTNSRRNRFFIFAVEKIGRSGWCRAVDKDASLFLHGFFIKGSILMNTITITASTEPTDYTFTEAKNPDPVETKREKLIRLLKTYGVSAPDNAELSDLENLYGHVLELEAPDLDFPEGIRNRLDLKKNRDLAALAALPVAQFRECVRLTLKHDADSICLGTSLSSWIVNAATRKIAI